MSHEKKPILRAPRASSAMLPLAILLALACGALLLALSGYSPIEAYGALLRGSFGNLNAIAEVLVKTTPLLLAALGLTISNRAQVISIGAEGQIYLGAMVRRRWPCSWGRCRPTSPFRSAWRRASSSAPCGAASPAG